MKTVHAPEIKHPLIIITGPTGSGKSSAAIELANLIGGYIINADSRQIYNEMRIGTAQPIPDSTKDDKWFIDGIEHYLYGHVGIEEEYNLSTYQHDVYCVLAKNPTKPAILVGGTGMYVDAVVNQYDLDSETDRSDGQLSSRNELNSLTLDELQNRIAPELLKQLNESDRNNPVRLVRIIERGLPTPSEASYEHIYLVLDPGKVILDAHLASRIDEMFIQGLESENQKLWEQYRHKTKSLQSIGYKEFVGYFEGDKTIEQVKEEINMNTRKYAKRQRTWFRRNDRAIWLEKYDQGEVAQTIEKVFSV